MKNKNKIKQKAVTLAVTSVMGTGFLVNNNYSVFAMKSLKKIFSSTPSEKKLAKLMFKKIGHIKYGLSLSSNDETKLTDNLSQIVVPGGYVKIFYKDQIIVVNPIIFCLKEYFNSYVDANSGHYYRTIRSNFKELLNWIKKYIPEAFDSCEILGKDCSNPNLLFFLLGLGDYDRKDCESSASKICDKELKKRCFNVRSKAGREEYEKIKKDVKNICEDILKYKPDIKKSCKYRYKDSSTNQIREVDLFEYAHIMGFGDIAEMFLDKENSQYKLFQAITGSKYSSSTTEIETLISQGANVKQPVFDEKGTKFDPMILALKSGNKYKVECLVKHGAVIPKNALTIALIERNRGLFDYLVDKGFKLPDGEFVIDLIFKNFSSWVDKFWEDSTNIVFIDYIISSNKIPVTWSSGSLEKFFDCPIVWKYQDLSSFYIKNCKNMPANTLYSICYRHYLSEYDKVRAVTFYLDNNCGSVRDVTEGSPLYEACGYGNFDLAKLLIKHGANLKFYKKDLSGNITTILGNTIERFPSRWDKVKIKDFIGFVKFLVNEHDVPVTGPQYISQGLVHAFRDFFFDRNTDFTPSDKADIDAIIDLAQFLIDKGMNVNALSTNHMTIREKVEQWNFTALGTALMDLFIKNGAKLYI